MAFNLAGLYLIIMGVVIATDLMQGQTTGNNNVASYTMKGRIPLERANGASDSTTATKTTTTSSPPTTRASTTDLTSTTKKSMDNDKKEKEEKDKDGLTKLNEKINNRIRLLMESSKRGHYQDNDEFNMLFSILENALDLKENAIDVKYHFYDRFRQYNDNRLKLEKLITKRMKAITKILIDRPDSVSDYCRKVYKMQLAELDDVLEFSNDLKSYKLETNSKTCQSDDDDDDYDDYFYL
ncbi:uncharacterized protein [Drosophila tropicalis]|uniref:uncharacterized protein isoform X2 n=1 Tax=Drosophila tropicalis TaxID=46794 RepID=UPI0035AB6F02